MDSERLTHEAQLAIIEEASIDPAFVAWDSVKVTRAEDGRPLFITYSGVVFMDQIEKTAALLYPIEDDNTEDTEEQDQ